MELSTPSPLRRTVTSSAFAGLCAVVILASLGPASGAFLVHVHAPSGGLVGSSTVTFSGRSLVDKSAKTRSTWLAATDDDKVPDAPKPAVSTVPSLTVGSGAEADASELTSRLLAEAREIGKCASILFEYVTKSDSDATAEGIVALCDDLDGVRADLANDDIGQDLITVRIDLRSRALRAARYEMLNKLMRSDYDAYVATASFLSPSRIPREELPNVQDVPYPELPKELVEATDLRSEEGEPLVADCTLEDKFFDDSPLDKLLLGIFRDLVEKNTDGISSPKPGIEGLLEQGRTYMVQPGQTAEAQHKMVKDTLGGLMTPVLPPFYRVFMSGIVPKLGTEWDGKQIGPWFYAPWLTSIVTPTFFGFLVGPSRPNSRKDGQPGGLVVEKCKFLQESGCKGLCLHQCKLPAQQFFKEELGLDLTVSPNFVTQECQWSFGEVPLAPEEDPSFPRGCLVGCESRKAMAGTYESGSRGKQAVSCL